MTGKKGANELLIKLPERVDSGSATAFEAELASLRGANPGGRLVFDAAAMEYISSAGLRVILKRIKMETERAAWINASPAVYEILDITGFTDMLDVKRAFPQVSVEGCPVVGRGGLGTVYRLDEDRVVKVYRPDVEPDRLEAEREKAKRAFVSGVPTTISYQVVRCGECYGTIYELVRSRSLAETLRDASEDEVYELIRKFAELMRELNGIVLEKGTYPNAKSVFHARADRCLDFYDGDREIIDLAHKIIDSIPDRDNLIHGDFHTGNVMIQDGELLIIDLDSLCQGHPIFDLMTAHPVIPGLKQMPRDPGSAYRMFGLKPEYHKKALDIFHSTYFGTEREELLNQYQEEIAVYAPLRNLLVLPESFALIGREQAMAHKAALVEQYKPLIREGKYQISF